MAFRPARSGGGRNPFPGGQFSWPPPSRDARIAALAGRQHGVITTAQLAKAGLTYSGTSTRAASGRLHRKYPGVYAVGQPRLSEHGEWMGAILACGPGSYLASLTAAVHMKLWLRRVTGIHVLAPRGRAPRGVCMRAYRRLDPLDVTERAGIPVTTAARTLVDLSDVLTPHQLANVIREATFRKQFHERAVRAAMQRANGRHNLHVLERALELNQAGSAGTRSDLEDRFLALTTDPACPNRSSTPRSRTSRSTSTGPTGI